MACSRAPLTSQKQIGRQPQTLFIALDAAHLIRVVNRAHDEDIENLLTVHDSFACLAPQAAHLGKIVREELCDLYTGDRKAVRLVEQLLQNSGLPWRFNGMVPLVKLVTKNSTGEISWPAFGKLDPRQVRTATYCFH